MKYEDLYDFFQELSKDLAKGNYWKVKQPVFRNNADISAKVQLLQRLQKYTANILTEVNIFEPDEFKILCHEYSLDNTLTVHYLNHKIFTVVAFQEEHLRQAVEGINAQEVVASH